MSSTSDLAALGEPVRRRFAARHEAREIAYAASRDAIRSAANAIRAIHRGEGDRADQLIATSRDHLDRGYAAVEDVPSVRWSGFLQDAAKEYAEARLTRLAVAGEPLVGPEHIGVDDTSWLHGLAETVGECRRQALDNVRRGDLDEGERLLEVMDDVLAVLATIDVPDGLTRGLRRQADGARAITERTRGDLTTSRGQFRLQQALEAHREVLGAEG